MSRGAKTAIRDLRLSVAVPMVRLWFGIRGCAPSIVAGGSLAAAGIGKPGPPVPPPAATANRALAAWIVRQVSPDVSVSCVPVMCRQWQENGLGDLPPGVSSALPLRGAGIGVTSPAATSAILAFLHAQQGTYRPAEAAT